MIRRWPVIFIPLSMQRCSRCEGGWSVFIGKVFRTRGSNRTRVPKIRRCGRGRGRRLPNHRHPEKCSVSSVWSISRRPTSRNRIAGIIEAGPPLAKVKAAQAAPKLQLSIL
jgi:hypothetical protein